MRISILLAVMVIGCGSALVAGGCVGARESARFTVDDVELIGNEMAAKLAGSDLLRGRGRESETLWVTMQPASNETLNERLTSGERWLLVDRVVDARMMMALRREKNIRFVRPAEFVRNDSITQEQTAGAGAGVGDNVMPPGRKPTHVLTATVKSAVRNAGMDATVGYFVNYKLTRLSDAIIVWADDIAWKRTTGSDRRD